MSEFEVAEQLIRDTRAAMKRKERESLVWFLVFWLCVAVTVATPLTLAGAAHRVLWQPLMTDDSGTSTDTDPGSCTSTNNGTATATHDHAADTDAETSTPLYILTWQEGRGEIFTVKKAESKDTDKHCIVSHDRYQAEVRFIAAMALFCLGSLAVLFAQARTFIRYWMQANDDRADSNGILIGRYTDAILLIFTIILMYILAVLSQRGLTISILLMIVPVIQLICLVLKPVRSMVFSGNPLVAVVDKRSVQADLSYAPVLMLPPTMAIGLLIGSFGFDMLEESLKESTVLIMWAEPLFIFSVALLFSIAVYSGVLFISVARDFPSQRGAMAIARGSFDNPFLVTAVAADLWDYMARYVREKVGDASLTEFRSKNSDVFFPALTLHEARRVFPANPTFSTASAKVGDRLIRKASLPLALVMATSLIVLGLGLDLNSIGPKASDALATERDASETALILLLGTSMVISFAMMVGYSLIRLDYFIHEAPEDNTSPGSGDKSADANAENTITSQAGNSTQSGDGFDWRFDEIGKVRIDLHPSTEALYETILRRHVGAGKDKFVSILGTVSSFAAFQDLLGRGWNQRFMTVLTALAPVTVPTVIELLK